jgi:hypothetical protein
VGSARGYICQACGTRFAARSGGGFFFDLLHCDACGRSHSVAHKDLGKIHLGFVKGLRVPYALARAAMDRSIQENYPGPTLTREEYHEASEATLEPCPCGGHFLYAAEARCPSCRSTSEMWDHDPTQPTSHYD